MLFCSISSCGEPFSCCEVFSGGSALFCLIVSVVDGAGIGGGGGISCVLVGTSAFVDVPLWSLSSMLSALDSLLTPSCVESEIRAVDTSLPGHDVVGRP